MNAIGLPARIVYALAAISAVGSGGFYSGILLLPKLASLLGDPAAGAKDSQTFLASICIGALLAFTASLLVLTLPWRRRRKRRGRRARAIVSTVVVFVASLIFTQQSHSLILDLAVVLWLAYILTYTFVRYGVLDQRRRTVDPSDVLPSLGPPPDIA